MTFTWNPCWLTLGIVPAIILAGLALNYRRAKRWDRRIRETGQVHCRDCHYEGRLLVRTLAGSEANSGNLRLVCGECNGPNWYIPGQEQVS